MLRGLVAIPLGPLYFLASFPLNWLQKRAHSRVLKRALEDCLKFRELPKPEKRRNATMIAIRKRYESESLIDDYVRRGIVSDNKDNGYNCNPTSVRERFSNSLKHLFRRLKQKITGQKKHNVRFREDPVTGEWHFAKDANESDEYYVFDDEGNKYLVHFNDKLEYTL